MPSCGLLRWQQQEELHFYATPHLALGFYCGVEKESVVTPHRKRSSEEGAGAGRRGMPYLKS